MEQMLHFHMDTQKTIVIVNLRVKYLLIAHQSML